MKHKAVQLAIRAVAAFLLTVLACPWDLMAQGGKITVKGTVLDSEGLPVFGAGITVKGTTTGVIAADDGSFEIQVPSESSVIMVSALGYVDYETTVGKQRLFNVVLREDMQSIEATVVVAYGVQTKATVTGALTSIDSKALTKAPVADVSNVLAGQMPGVTTIQDNGQPGEDYAQIFVRGVSSLSSDNATPLILVDGVERPLNTVDPNEIESLSVLKDAASTAVFGVRGANGVIIVTTKRGDAGKPKISFSSITGIQQPLSYLKQVSSYEYASFWNLKAELDGVTDPRGYFSKEAVEAYRTGSDPLMYPNTNWNELMFNKVFMQTKNNINISGGSDKVRYFVSMGYMYQDGLLKQMPKLSYDNNFAYNRYNYRANLDFKLTETTDMKFNIGGVIGMTQEPRTNQDNAWIYTLLWAYPFSSPGMVNDIPITIVSLNAIPSSLDSRWNAYNAYYGLGYNQKYKTSLNMDISLTQRLDFVTQGLSAGIKASYDTDMYI